MGALEFLSTVMIPLKCHALALWWPSLQASNIWQRRDQRVDVRWRSPHPPVRCSEPSQCKPSAQLVAGELLIGPGAIRPGQRLTYAVLLDGKECIGQVSPLLNIKPTMIDETQPAAGSGELVIYGRDGTVQKAADDGTMSTTGKTPGPDCSDPSARSSNWCRSHCLPVKSGRFTRSDQSDSANGPCLRREVNRCQVEPPVRSRGSANGLGANADCSETRGGVAELIPRRRESRAI